MEIGRVEMLVPTFTGDTDEQFAAAKAALLS
jgi:hypothetical protein